MIVSIGKQPTRAKQKEAKRLSQWYRDDQSIYRADVVIHPYIGKHCLRTSSCPNEMNGQ